MMVSGEIMEHELKSSPEFFQPTIEGRKRHELRRNDDRKFQVGDIVVLREFDHGTKSYTGRTVRARISYITSREYPCALSPEALGENYCILSLDILES